MKESESEREEEEEGRGGKKTGTSGMRKESKICHRMNNANK